MNATSAHTYVTNPHTGLLEECSKAAVKLAAGVIRNPGTVNYGVRPLCLQDAALENMTDAQITSRVLWSRDVLGSIRSEYFAHDVDHAEWLVMEERQRRIEECPRWKLEELVEAQFPEDFPIYLSGDQFELLVDAVETYLPDTETIKDGIGDALSLLSSPGQHGARYGSSDEAIAKAEAEDDFWMAVDEEWCNMKARAAARIAYHETYNEKSVRLIDETYKRMTGSEPTEEQSQDLWFSTIEKLGQHQGTANLARSADTDIIHAAASVCRDKLDRQATQPESDSSTGTITQHKTKVAQTGPRRDNDSPSPSMSM